MFLKIHSHYIKGDHPVSTPYKVTGGVFNVKLMNKIGIDGGFVLKSLSRLILFVRIWNFLPITHRKSNII